MKEIMDIIYLIVMSFFVIVVAINEILTSRQIKQLEERIETLEGHAALSQEIDKNILDYLTRGGKKNERP